MVATNLESSTFHVGAANFDSPHDRKSFSLRGDIAEFCCIALAGQKPYREVCTVNLFLEQLSSQL